MSTRSRAQEPDYTPSAIENDLWNAIANHPDTTLKQISTDYRVRTASASERLAAWFRLQPGVSVTVDTVLPTIDQALKQGAAGVEVVRNTYYWVTVVGRPLRLSRVDLHNWASMLEQAPKDPDWQIQGFGLLNP